MIYENIKKAAKDKNISIRKIEIDLGFSNGSIRQWGKNINIHRLGLVANYLKVPIENLLGIKK